MNKSKLILLFSLLRELQMHLKDKLDMGKQAGGTQGHKWGYRLGECKKFQKIIKNMLTGF
jgi:hypothetical protein